MVPKATMPCATVRKFSEFFIDSKNIFAFPTEAILSNVLSASFPLIIFTVCSTERLLLKNNRLSWLIFAPACISFAIFRNEIPW